MVIQKLYIHNFKIFGEKIIPLNENVNIFVGENDSGKSTILEALSIITCGRINNISFERQLKTDLFHSSTRQSYIKEIEDWDIPTPTPPVIEIEAYCKNDPTYADFKGTNNHFGEDCPGIRMALEFDNDYAESYKKLIADESIHDIPLEFYKLSYITFKGERLMFRQCPFKTACIDTSKKDYSNVINRFVSDNVSSYLSDSEQIDLRVAYRKNHGDFKSNEIVDRLNTTIEENVKLADKKVNLGLREQGLDDWKNQLTISVDDIPFDHIGIGSQNVIKVELVLKNKQEDTNILLIEEPENNLSYGNMSKLISKIQQNIGKQIFISTHSSFVANKLGLKNIHLVSNGEIAPLNGLDNDTMNYFKKLPGYDTLRLVLANEVILVEGPTDDLIVQRAYYDKYGHLPIDDGIDVIVVDSLAFKRYCDLANLIQKKIKIITDNDGDIEKNIHQKYSDYLASNNVDVYYDTDESSYTIEICVLKANEKKPSDFKNFKKAISKNNSMVEKDRNEIESFLIKNKAEWSMRIFDYETNIKYPQYILNAIKK